MADLRYYLGPLEWVTEDGLEFWRPPLGTVGMVDLATIADFDGAGSDRQLAFLAVDGSLTSEWSLVGEGDFRELAATSAIQDAWESVTGYRPSGPQLVDLLWDHLTNGSDPDWVDGPKPLMPTRSGNLDLYVGGHSLVRRERFRFGEHPHTDLVKSLLQRDYRLIHERDIQHAQKVLGYWLLKYGLSFERRQEWVQLIPSNLRQGHPGPLRPETTLTESFTGTGTDVGSDLTWTDVDGDWQRVNDHAEMGIAEDLSSARAESDLSGSDHYTQSALIAFNTTNDGGGTNSTNNVAVAVRFDNTAETAYLFRRRHGAGRNSGVPDMRLFKIVSGTQTALGSDWVVESYSAPETVKVECDGSQITGFLDDVQKDQVTDTSITGNLRGGINGFIGINRSTSEVQLDDWEASDLATVQLGQAVDTSSAFAVSPKRTLTLGQAIDTQSAFAATARRDLVVGQAVSAETARAVTAKRAVTLQQASETDTAFAATPLRTFTAGLASESDQALAAQALRTLALGRADETDTAPGATVVTGADIAVGQAVETDTAPSATVQRMVSVGQAVETDTAPAVKPLRTLTVGQALETVTAFAVTPERGLTVGIATETDTAFATGVLTTVTLGQAVETDTAFSVTAIGAAVEIVSQRFVLKGTSQERLVLESTSQEIVMLEGP